MDREKTQPFDAATTVDHPPEANRPVPPLLLSSRRHEAIIDHLRRSLPNEGCGLIGSVPAAQGERGVHFFPGTNVDRSPVRYTMDPREVVDAMWWMRTLGWNLAAIVHSHPSTAPMPSRTDLHEWYYPEARLLIVSFAGPEPIVGCWQMARDGETNSFRSAPWRIEER